MGTSLSRNTGVRPAWSLLPHDLVCRPGPRASLRAHRWAARTRGGPESNPLCLLSGSKGRGAHLWVPVLGGAPQPCPLLLEPPFTRAVRAPRRRPPPAPTAPGTATEAAKSWRSRLVPGSPLSLTSGSPPPLPWPFGKTWGSCLWFLPSFSKAASTARKSFSKTARWPTDAISHETLSRQVKVEDLSRAAE